MEEKLSKDIKNEMKKLIDNYGIIVISQYLLNQKNVKESFEDAARKNPNTYQSRDYQQVIIENNLWRTDSEIINMIYDKTFEMDYDEENELARAKTLFGVAALLRNNITTDEPKWQNIRQRVIALLLRMSSRDFMTTIEIAGIEIACKLPGIMQMIKDRIPKMSEVEFMRMYADMSSKGIEIDDELNSLISKKAEDASNVLIPKYILMVRNPEDVIKLMERAEAPERIETMINALKHKDETVKNGVIKLASKLTDNELVRFMVATKDLPYTSNELDNYVLERVEKFNDQNLKLIMMAYVSSNRINIRNRIFQIALDKGLAVKDSNGIHMRKQLLEDGKLTRRLSMYQNYNNTISKLPTMQCEPELSFALEMATKMSSSTEEDLEMVDKMMQKELLDQYHISHECIGIHEEVVEYIKRLSEEGENEFVTGTVSMFKAVSKKLDDSIEDTPVNRMRRNAYNLTENYMYNRILELQDNGAIALLSTLHSQDNPSHNTIIGVKLEESMDKIKMNYTVDTGR